MFSLNFMLAPLTRYQAKYVSFSFTCFGGRLPVGYSPIAILVSIHLNEGRMN